MIKQLYYSEIYLKNIKIYLSKLYIGRYYEVHIEYPQKASFNSVDGGRITNYVTCVTSCVCVTKMQVQRHLLL